MQVLRMKFRHTKQADLFLNRENAFQRRMRNRLIFQNCEHIGNTVSVVTAEGGAACFQPAVFDIEVQRIFLKVVFNIIVLFADHVHMRLQDDGLTLLITGRSRLIDHDIPDMILLVRQVMGFCEGADIIADAFLVAGSARNF